MVWIVAGVVEASTGSDVIDSSTSCLKSGFCMPAENVENYGVR
jgi:hypothetical protein